MINVLSLIHDSIKDKDLSKEVAAVYIDTMCYVINLYGKASNVSAQRDAVVWALAKYIGNQSDADLIALKSILPPGTLKQ